MNNDELQRKMEELAGQRSSITVSKRTLWALNILAVRQAKELNVEKTPSHDKALWSFLTSVFPELEEHIANSIGIQIKMEELQKELLQQQKNAMTNMRIIDPKEITLADVMSEPDENE